MNEREFSDIAASTWGAETCDDEQGNCRRCGHPFNPHIIVAFEGNDFSKGGEMRCQVDGCPCFSTVSFDFKPASE
jgi:hypothetical protein